MFLATASETDEYVGGKAEAVLFVSKKELAWDTSALSAIDREDMLSQDRASLYGELKVNGILNKDADKVIFSCPAEKLPETYAAITPGTQKVFWSGRTQKILLRLQEKKRQIIDYRIHCLKFGVKSMKLQSRL